MTELSNTGTLVYPTRVKILAPRIRQKVVKKTNCAFFFVVIWFVYNCVNWLPLTQRRASRTETHWLSPSVSITWWHVPGGRYAIARPSPRAVELVTWHMPWSWMHHKHNIGRKGLVTMTHWLTLTDIIVILFYETYTSLVFTSFRDEWFVDFLKVHFSSYTTHKSQTRRKNSRNRWRKKAYQKLIF